ncbi:MAG: hypothetical protein MZV63_59060 [Marinilabiliales bacterium]|nr:hypothetical protein [Marinilabiliales bacterium]
MAFVLTLYPSPGMIVFDIINPTPTEQDIPGRSGFILNFYESSGIDQRIKHIQCCLTVGEWIANDIPS